MSDYQLTPGRVVYEYTVDGHASFKHDDEHYVAEDVYFEADPHYPEYVACQIVTTCNKAFTFNGNSHGNWPRIAQRLYDQHQKLRKQ